VQTYGYYQIRLRVDAGAGVSASALLWPKVGWPPEVDLFEDGSTGDTRTTITANLHYAPGDQRIHAGRQGVDFTTWHTVGVEWTPGELRYLLDGTVWATMTGAAVPSQPMALDLQTEYGAGTYAAATPARVTMDVAWVAVAELGSATDTSPGRARPG
jgi:beta-glucanase (GH16 family)